MKLELNLFLTIAMAVMVLIVGDFIKKRVEILRRFCIPVPVVGGLIFTILLSLGYSTGIYNFLFQYPLKTFHKPTCVFYS